MLAAILWAAIALCTGAVCAQEPADAAGVPPVTEVAVPLHEGRLELAELVTALLEAYELDSAQLDIPSTSIDVRGMRGQLALFACRKLLLDTVRFRRALDDSSLTLVIDRERAREVRRDLRTRVIQLIGQWTGEDLLERRYELRLPPAVDPERPLVVLIHGVESSPEVFADLRAYLEDKGLQLAVFAYPNDGPCDRAAVELARLLREQAPQRIRIVAHSMGGLIARAVVEDSELDPSNVDTLILIGTPNHGSNLAGLRFGLEAAHLLRGSSGTEDFGRALLEGARAGLLDGLGEAGGDLLPGSVFLTRLDQRERNPHVTYHLVLGTHSVLSTEQLDEVRGRVEGMLGESPIARIARPRVEQFFADLPELVDGEGDGAVAVASGRLEGVEPVLVPLDHLALIRQRGLLSRVRDADQHPVFRRIRAWLVGAPGAKPATANER